MNHSPNAKDFLATAIHSFFEQHLRAQRNASPQTVLSYRDAIKQFLLFAAGQEHVHFAALRFPMLDVDMVLGFLAHIENSRHVSVRTRNHRLAVLHTFFRHAMALDPEYFQQCSRIMNIPRKRGQEKVVDYLELDELKQIMTQPDRKTIKGRRDYLMLSLMYNTGCRVTELVHLAPSAFSLGPPHYVKLTGKGQKERYCPLWNQTVTLLREYMTERNLETNSNSALFVNQQSREITRFGVYHMLAGYHRRAIVRHPGLAKKKLHPHTIRHSTAVHLLQSGVEFNVIQRILGHVSIETTSMYAKVDMAMKRKAIETMEAGRPLTPSRWHQDKTLLGWLQSP